MGYSISNLNSQRRYKEKKFKEGKCATCPNDLEPGRKQCKKCLKRYSKMVKESKPKVKFQGDTNGKG